MVPASFIGPYTSLTYRDSQSMGCDNILISPRLYYNWLYTLQYGQYKMPYILLGPTGS